MDPKAKLYIITAWLRAIKQGVAERERPTGAPKKFAISLKRLAAIRSREWLVLP